MYFVVRAVLKGGCAACIAFVDIPFDKVTIPFVVEDVQGTPEEAVALFCQTVRDSRAGGKNQRVNAVTLLQEA